MGRSQIIGRYGPRYDPGLYLSWGEKSPIRAKVLFKPGTG